MMKLKNTVAALCAISILLSATAATPRPTGSRDDRDEPIKLYARASEGPIGVAKSLTPFVIDGREEVGQGILWGGELLRASGGGVRVSLGSLGEAALSRGAMVSFARSGRREGGEVLVASLSAGDVAIDLQGDARAYIQAGGLAFATSAGASLRLHTRGGAVTASARRGEVRQVQTSQKRYFIKPVGMGANLSVRARSSRQIQVQVTDENDRPVPDVPVVLALSSGLGSLGGGSGAAATTVTLTTNAQGLVTTTFSAGLAPGNASLTATIPGSSATFTTGIAVSTAGFFATTAGLLVIAAAGAGAAATVAAVKSGDSQTRETVTALPPDIRPR